MKKLFVIILFGVSGMVVAADPAAQNVMPAATEQTDLTSEESNVSADSAATTDATTTEATSSADAEAEQAGFSRGSVVRSIFTSAIQEREPVDKLNTATAEQEQVFYFTELRDMSGQTAIHRWEKDGDVQAEVKFDVRGPRWRVWSSKSFQPTAAGEWKVSVLNGAGEIIAEESLNLTATPAVQTSEPAAQEAPAAPAVQEFEPPVTDKLMQ